jgi:hypothetical protein
VRQRWWQCFQLFGEVIDQILLSKDLYSFRREIQFDWRRANLQASQLATKTDQMCHFLIAQLDHCVLNIYLCRDEFFAYRQPLAAARHVSETCAVPRHPIGDAEATSSLIKTRPRLCPALFLSASTTKNLSAINPPKTKAFCSRLPGLAFGNSRGSCSKGSGLSSSSC